VIFSPSRYLQNRQLIHDSNGFSMRRISRLALYSLISFSRRKHFKELTGEKNFSREKSVEEIIGLNGGEKEREREKNFHKFYAIIKPSKQIQFEMLLS
jgi:hypothetical protein